MTLRLRRRARAAIAGAIVAAMLAAPALSQSPSPANPADVRLDAIASHYFATTWQLDPVRGTLEGVHAGDDRLGDYTEDGYARRIASTRRTLRELVTIDFGDLSADHADDAAVLKAHLELELMSIEDRRTYRHDPTIYLRLAATAAQSLLERDYAPAQDRLHALVARERAIPAMLGAASKQTGDVDDVTIELTRQMLGGTLSYFQGPVAHAADGLGDAALSNALATSSLAVERSIADFGVALENGAFLHPAGSFAVGPERFNRMLQLEELAPDLTAGDFERTAIGALERSRSQFLTTSRRIDPAKTPAAVVAALDVDHPAEGKLLETATDDVDALERFVDDHHLVTLPPATPVRAVDAGSFAAGSPIAFVSVPGPLERADEVTYYNLTLPADPVPARRAAELARFNDFVFPLISAHEVMPGHFVNLELARREHLSEVRRLLPSRSFTEGWAHYAEQMVVEEGWGNGDPRVRLAELQLELQRECRAIVALRLHAANMTIADATAFFMENAYLPEEAARQEALRAAHDPMVGVYLLGKLEILKLRDDYKNRLGARFSLEEFHDALLAHGNPPVAIARKLLLGSDDDGRILY